MSAVTFLGVIGFFLFLAACLALGRYLDRDEEGSP